jgi:hypothetical protein
MYYVLAAISGISISIINYSSPMIACKYKHYIKYHFTNWDFLKFEKKIPLKANTTWLTAAIVTSIPKKQETNHAIKA